jgi:hypothetical protein
VVFCWLSNVLVTHQTVNTHKKEVGHFIFQEEKLGAKENTHKYKPVAS